MLQRQSVKLAMYNAQYDHVNSSLYTGHIASNRSTCALIGTAPRFD